MDLLGQISLPRLVSLISGSKGNLIEKKPLIGTNLGPLRQTYLIIFRLKTEGDVRKNGSKSSGSHALSIHLQGKSYVTSVFWSMGK